MNSPELASSGHALGTGGEGSLRIGFEGGRTLGQQESCTHGVVGTQRTKSPIVCSRKGRMVTCFLTPVDKKDGKTLLFLSCFAGS